MRPLTLSSRIRAAVDGFMQGPPEDAHRGEGYPPPYPAGWYRVVNASEVRPGSVSTVRCLGRRFVVFRGVQSGRVAAFDAFCPHQGADLGGGCVVADTLQCPFHHWTFSPNGEVESVPGARKLPKARAAAYPAREVDGMIWLFFDPETLGGAAPYEPERHRDVETGELRYLGEHDAGDVRMHLIEFAENSVDFQHFQPLHGAMLIPWTQVAIPLLTVRHEAGWELDAARPHVAFFRDDASLRVFGRAIPRSGASARITLFGPGGIVYFRFAIPDLGEILMYQTHTPVGPMRQRVYFRWFASRRIPRALASYVVGSWVSQWQRDITIWENKIYRRTPVLSSADGPVHRMRRWYQQFYANEDGGSRAQP